MNKNLHRIFAILVALTVSTMSYSYDVVGKTGDCYFNCTVVTGGYVEVHNGNSIILGSFVKIYPSGYGKSIPDNLSSSEKYIVSSRSEQDSDGSVIIAISLENTTNIVDVSDFEGDFGCVMLDSSYTKVDILDTFDFDREKVFSGTETFFRESLLVRTTYKLRTSNDFLYDKKYNLSSYQNGFFSSEALFEDVDLGAFLSLKDSFEGIITLDSGCVFDLYVDEGYCTSVSFFDTKSFDSEMDTLQLNSNLFSEDTVFEFREEESSLAFADIDDNNIKVIEIDNEVVSLVYVPNATYSISVSNNSVYLLDFTAESYSKLSTLDESISDVRLNSYLGTDILIVTTESKIRPVYAQLLFEPFLILPYQNASYFCDKNGYFSIGGTNIPVEDFVLLLSRSSYPVIVLYTISNYLGAIRTVESITGLPGLGISVWELGNVADAFLDTTNMVVVILYENNKIALLKIDESFVCLGYSVFDISTESEYFYLFESITYVDGTNIGLSSDMAFSTAGFTEVLTEPGGDFDHFDFTYSEVPIGLNISSCYVDYTNNDYYFSYKDFLIKYDGDLDKYYSSHSYGGLITSMTAQGNYFFISITNVACDVNEYPQSRLLRYDTLGDIEFQEGDFTIPEIVLFDSYFYADSGIGKNRLPSPLQYNTEYFISDRESSYSIYSPYIIVDSYKTKGSLLKNAIPLVDGEIK